MYIIQGQFPYSPFTKKYELKNKAFPNVSISDHSISLPVGPHINKETIEIIYNNLIKIISKPK